MYINFQEINPILINSLTKKFNLDPNKLTILYKITNIKENKFDEFEKSIFPYLFIDNTYYIEYEDSIYKIKSKLESSTKISTENIISSIKLKISKDDIYKMYNNLNSMFTIFKDDYYKSQVKIMSLYDSCKEKTLKYAYIHGSLIV